MGLREVGPGWSSERFKKNGYIGGATYSCNIAEAWSTSRQRLHMRAGKKELLLVLLVREPLSFRHLHTSRLPRGEGVRQ